MFYGYGVSLRIMALGGGLTLKKTIRNFRPLETSIESVYLVEASPSLREQQKALLCGDMPMDEVAIGFQSRSKYDGIPVVWCEDIRFVPKGSIFFFFHYI